MVNNVSFSQMLLFNWQCSVSCLMYWLPVCVGIMLLHITQKCVSYIQVDNNTAAMSRISVTTHCLQSSHTILSADTKRAKLEHCNSFSTAQSYFHILNILYTNLDFQSSISLCVAPCLCVFIKKKSWFLQVNNFNRSLYISGLFAAVFCIGVLF